MLVYHLGIWYLHKRTQIHLVHVGADFVWLGIHQDL